MSKKPTNSGELSVRRDGQRPTRSRRRAPEGRTRKDAGAYKGDVGSALSVLLECMDTANDTDVDEVDPIK